MDVPMRQHCRPVGEDVVERHRQLPGQAGLHLVCPGQAAVEQRAPTGWAQRIRPLRHVAATGEVQGRQRIPYRRAMGRSNPARPNAREERRDTGRPTREVAQRLAIPRPHWLRAGDAASGQMLHQTQEPGQLRRIDPFFVQSEDEVARAGAQREIAVLDPPPRCRGKATTVPRS